MSGAPESGTEPPQTSSPAPGEAQRYRGPGERRRIQRLGRHLIEVFADDRMVAYSRQAVRLLGGVGAPAIWLPHADISTELLRGVPLRSPRGAGTHLAYSDVVTETARFERAACSLEETCDTSAAVAGWLAFDAERLACYVDGQRVKHQQAGAPGGWITADVVLPGD